MNDSPVRRTSSARQFVVLLLLFLGVQCWIVLGRAQLGERRQLIAAVIASVVALVVCCLRRRGPGGADILVCPKPTFGRLTNPSPRGRLLTAVALTLLATIYLYFTARFQHRDLSPILHDEYCYLIQTKMLAAGHLWLPKHPLGEFFDSFHLITDRVYASKYGPGTAAFFAPAMLLHLPIWLTPLLLSSVAVGLMYLVATELFDGASGFAAAILLLSLGIVRRTSVMMMSQAPMLTLVLLAMLAYIHWRRNHRGGWMLLLGVCIGWGALTRPVDAICLAVPLAVGVLIDLKPLDARARVKQIGIGLCAVLPFVLLQLVYNKGVTGSARELPWNYYAQRYDPYDSMSRAPFDPALRPQTRIAQLLAMYDDFTVPYYREKLARSRFDSLVNRATLTLAGPPLEEQEPKRLIYGALPTPLLIALLPVGLLALCHRRLWIFWLPLPLFVAMYANYTFFFPHYAVAIVPVVILNLLAAKEVLQRTWPTIAHPLGVIFVTAVIALSVAALPELDPVRRDQWFSAPLLRRIDRDLAAIDRPAIVLFTYDPDRLVHEEPVFNTDAAWPDDAKVIRAHDLGDADNRPLIAYYAARAPARAVYRYDEKTRQLTYLDAATELSRSSAGSGLNPHQ